MDTSHQRIKVPSRSEAKHEKGSSLGKVGKWGRTWIKRSPYVLEKEEREKRILIIRETSPKQIKRQERRATSHCATRFSTHTHTQKERESAAP